MRSAILDDTRLTCSLHLQLQREFLCQPVYAKITNALQYALYNITLYIIYQKYAFKVTPARYQSNL